MSGRTKGTRFRQHGNPADVCFLVSHTHWDREWYRTFEQFRARLVDALDYLLTLLDEDPEYRFVLDGQSIIVQDYLAMRPRQRSAITEYCRQGRLAVGPWYVQPDSFLPAGETHIRNLLFGIRHARRYGPHSQVAYTPDSFGHPAQFPQLFAGFGLKLFVYWRGNGDELDTLPSTFAWVGPDGSEVVAHHLAEGYFNAARLPADPDKAALILASTVERLRQRNPTSPVLLLHGIDHAFPQRHTQAIADRLAGTLGSRVVRGSLDDFAAAVCRPQASYKGELRGARVANLLPGVWSSRMYLKAENRRCESLLLHWLEPWAAIALALTGNDERPAIELAWLNLLENQAHDSIGGCSQDLVHQQMLDRYTRVREIAEETTRRILERLSGLEQDRETPRSEPWLVYVFNPSPFVRTDLVRLPLDPHPWFGFSGEDEPTLSLHPWLVATATSRGFVVDGVPARIVSEEQAPRLRLQLAQPPRALEFVARNVPAFGCVCVTLETQEEVVDDTVDDGREIGNDLLHVKAAPSGTFDLYFFESEACYRGLGEWEDLGDRGDTYDFDPVPRSVSLEGVRFRRTRHPSGIQTLRIERLLRVPRMLTPSRDASTEETVLLSLVLELLTAPGLPRLLVDVFVNNTACDHRLRLLFPTGEPTETCVAATTFDVAVRPTHIPPRPHWVHPPPHTFPHQGFVSANGLTVVAPELPEAEVTPDGTIAITLVRAVGWLSLPGLHTRPELAGPTIATPGAQCLGLFRTKIALSHGLAAHAAHELSAGLWPVVGGERPVLSPGQSLLSIEPREILLSALLPAPRKRRLWLRLLNPWGDAVDASVHFGFRVDRIHSVRLDGTRTSEPFEYQKDVLTCRVNPHQLRSFALDLAPLPD